MIISGLKNVALAAYKDRYDKTNQLVEKISEITYLLFVKVSSKFFTFPFYIVSYYTYYVMGSEGEDAFQLLAPMRHIKKLKPYLYF